MASSVRPRSTTQLRPDVTHGCRPHRVRFVRTRHARSARRRHFANRSNDTMKVITTAEEFHVEDLFLDLSVVVGQELFLKCEGFNFAGSIKLKPAIEMI